MPRIPRDDYYVHMWNFYEPFYSSGPEKAALAIRRFREMGCNAATLIATFVHLDGYKKSLDAFGLPMPSFTMENWNDFPFRENRMPFYVENICRPLYWNWNEAKPLFRQQYEAFHQNRDRSVFIRVPCVNNPTVMDAMKKRIDEIMDGLREVRDLSLLYDLRDEPTITSFILASDLCFCEHCMARMREWLGAAYGDLAALNAGWGTEFRSWDDVVPLTTEEALERRAAGNWNFAPWADHRTFMNDSFARACAECAARIREHDPEALVGLAGTQCPSVFGGYDFYKIAQAIDWAEPYDFGGSVDCLRSFKPRRRFPLLKTSGLGGGVDARRAMLWHYLLQSGGYGGTILWQSNAMFDPKSEDIAPMPGTQEFGEMLAELRTGIPRLLQVSDEVSSPVAIHYSHASIHADFITSLPHRWRSIAGWFDEKGGVYKAREAWWHLLEDQGLRPVFMSTQQIEAGALKKRGIRLLILPRSIALSDAEAAAMRRFVRAGGVLVADSFAGRMDEHCRERETGVLDDLLGIRRLEGDNYHASDEQINLYRRWDGTAFQGRLVMHGCRYIEERIEPVGKVTVMGQTELTDSNVGIVAKRGRGRTLLTNAVPLNYVHERRSGLAGPMRELFGAALEMAGIKPILTVSARGSDAAMPGWRAFEFHHGANRYFGASADIGVAQDVLGAIQVAEHGKDSRARVTVRFPVSGHIYEARSGRYLGKGATADVELGPFDVPIFAVTPCKAKAMKLCFSGGTAKARLLVAGGAPGERVFRFDVLDARGKRLLDSGANVVAKSGAAEWTPDTALPKKGRLVCRDVATGVRAEVRLG